MNSRFLIFTALALTLAGPATSQAAPSGVQWSLDGARLLVNKDVGNERWAITLNLNDLSATGNVFFTNDQSPAFIFCSNTGSDFESDVGELNLHYTCHGADAGLGGFAQEDWTLISDSVSLPLSFFIPDTETCDLSSALNGPSVQNAGSEWDCGGSEGTFRFQIFSNGTASNDATGGLFEYDAIAEACRIARLDDDSFLDLEYSPSRDHLTIYEVPADGTSLIVSECSRVDF